MPTVYVNDKPVEIGNRKLNCIEAAELAVHFSKQRHATRATVHLAAIRDVRKPRGAKPGLVHVQRGRSLSLRRDASRLARILDARIEDED